MFCRLYYMFEKSQTTISQILDAAQHAFIESSYDDVSMAAIARAANITKGAIYHHFSGKEDLFLQMMERYLCGLRKLLQTAVNVDGSAQDRLTQLTLCYLEQPPTEQHVIQLVRRDANRFTDATRQRLITTYQEALPDPIEAIIVDGIANEEIVDGDTRLMAWQFVAIVEVYLSDYARSHFTEPVDMAEHVASLFFTGVGKLQIGKDNG